ncbi:flagellar protein FlaG [Glaciecola sp. XM2]|jgi:flagellar protein FlaG|uniref:flagellar protein FlaG n=1 Tax=Glaciecola sp. XM2 TaxID=1914931 RepID=UPI001BDF4A75|nr:flagellar protein FlaG [Glaciecola sp. XM2]MBT1450807.1 flagellar protein FlaG [Glaciecola sp. XM2]
MDNINSQIGQNIARDSASVINDKTFNVSNVVGLASGASAFTKSENPALTQQVKNAEKSTTQLSEQQRSDQQKKLKVADAQADISAREESVDLRDALGDVGEFLSTKGTALQFSVDEKSERQVVTVTDAANGDVIRQIPSEEVLTFAARVRELESTEGNSVGLLLDKRA